MTHFESPGSAFGRPWSHANRRRLRPIKKSVVRVSFAAPRCPETKLIAAFLPVLLIAACRIVALVWKIASCLFNSLKYYFCGITYMAKLCDWLICQLSVTPSLLLRSTLYSQAQQLHPRGMLCLVLSVLPHQCYSSVVDSRQNYKKCRAFISAILLNLSLRHCDSTFLFRDLGVFGFTLR